MNNDEQTVMNAIYNRRSIRSYIINKPVEKDKILKLLDAGMAAPSACNLQPWEFIVVTEAEPLSCLEGAITQGVQNAPMAMVICGNTSKTPWKSEDWKIDCSAAVENMMLVATTIGLGSVWIGSFEDDKVREIFDIPDSIGIMSVIYFGYPALSPIPKSRFNEEAIFWQKYDPKRERKMRTIEMLGDASTRE